MGDELASLEAEIYRLAGERVQHQLAAAARRHPVREAGVSGARPHAQDEELLHRRGDRSRSWRRAAFRCPSGCCATASCSKLKSTYVDALPQLVDPTAASTPASMQAVAATGRLSSANPNLQNIPVRTEQGQRIRRAFIAAPGLLPAGRRLQPDRAAHPRPHRQGAGADRGLPLRARTSTAPPPPRSSAGSPELVTADQRRAAKTINFGILYGMSAVRPRPGARHPAGEAEPLHRGLPRALSAASAPTSRRRCRSAERDGKVETLYGRVRWLPDIQARTWQSARERPPHGHQRPHPGHRGRHPQAGDDRASTGGCAQEHPQARLLLTVHDELVLEVPEAAAEASPRW